MNIEIVDPHKPLGMMQLSHCPDCKVKLSKLMKISEDVFTMLGVRAKVCENPECWRYTKVMDILTWKRKI